MGYDQVLSTFGSGGAGGGGYSGEIKSDVKSGGTSAGAFGAINYGANSKLGGSTASATGDQGGSNILMYVAIAVVALVGIVIYLRR